MLLKIYVYMQCSLLGSGESVCAQKIGIVCIANKGNLKNESACAH